MSDNDKPLPPMPNGAAPAGRIGWRHILRALKHRNYALFFGGQGISVIGTWMQSVSLGWLVYEMTGSKVWLGIIGFSSQIMSFALFPFAGVFGDRWNRHRMLIVTQSLAALQALILAGLCYAGVVHDWHIVVLAMFLGTISAFDIPIRQSFVVEMVGNRREDLPSAIALNSALVNGGRMIGPALAGVMIDAWGVAPCFLANGISYLAVIAALLAMNVMPRKIAPAAQSVLESFKEGFRYTYNHRPIRWAVLLLAFVGLVAMPYQVLMPAVAKDVLAGDARTLGFLVGSAGMGALFGALFLASRRGVVGLERLIAVAPLIFGTALIALSFSRILPLSMGLLAAVGFGLMVNMASTNTLVQTLVDDKMRGRVMSFYSMAFLGMAPFGNLMLGGIAQKFEVPAALLVSGVACLAGGILFSSRLPAMIRSTRENSGQSAHTPDKKP